MIGHEFRVHRNAAVHHRPRVSDSTRQPVTSVKPNPQAWALALRLADNDPRRLRIISETEIIVENKPRGKQ
jgi:hypothetical protein